MTWLPFLLLAPSAPPENFNAVVGSPTSARIFWDPPPSEDINGLIIQYIINVTVIENGETFLLNSTTTSLNITQLQPYTTYICVIAAVTSVGRGPYSTQLTVITPQARKKDCIVCLYFDPNTLQLLLALHRVSSFILSVQPPSISHGHHHLQATPMES